MKRALILLCTTLAVPAFAQNGAPLGTLPVGRYQCSLPGDAGGAAWLPIEGKKFSIKNASRYLHEDGEGTYLLAGDDLVFTRGPMKDERYRRTGASMLRMKNADGTLSRIRCVRTGPLQSD
ncbi:elongation factor P [Erythrobacter sp. SDW2]|uniref:elongation factor P n=1 Tax=Erythrobacter sp. SDW2 TaxID=2907154 RepID=UPI001F4275A5|nr:elongation factor P [Erythrobacter sp. SDW2]UIP05939.1 elongation factor P [Erythrobacter sp. SDW2]